jgi:radical SAM protein with 4Fe4S-binding SPASM domain
VYVQLHRDAFVRRFEDLGFITNQASHEAEVFDVNGAAFLQHLSRTPQPLEIIAARIATDFADAPAGAVLDDLQDFLVGLETSGFVVTGSDEAELKEKSRAPTRRTTPMHQVQTDRGIKVASAGFFLERHFVKHPRLFAMQIEISGRCNERCIHCYFPWERTQKLAQLPTSVVLDVLDQLVPLGTVEVTFTGGEPLLNPDLAALLQRARRNDLSISLLTNAVLLSDEHIGLFAEFNVGLIQASVYSLDETVHDGITRVPGSLAKTRRAVERLVAENIQVQIGCPVMRQNLSGIGAVINWGKSLGIKVDPDLILMAKTDFGQENLSHRLSLDECRQAMETILECSDHYRARLENPEGERREKDPGLPICGVGTYMLCLGANGDFYPCPGFVLPLGSAYSQSVREVWEASPRMQELRQIKTTSYPACMACDAWDYCPICLAKNYNESGDLLNISPHFCGVSRLNKDLADRWRLTGSEPRALSLMDTSLPFLKKKGT